VAEPETAYRIEPCELVQIPAPLGDLIASIAARTATLGHKLHPRSAAGLADLVRVMNCYYSNLIEGHDTRPRDIERALLADWVDDPARRNLQLEALAHIRVQKEIDERQQQGRLEEPASREFLLWTHREFYREAPESMLVISSASGSYPMEPGAFRTAEQHDNVVGRHLPPSSRVIPDLMEYFERRFELANLGSAARIVAVAVAHHRLNFIHPFPDGNGRVSRLMSHAMGLRAGIGAHGLWSISRGLARGLEDRGEYKRMMDLADSPREGDLDGRGNLSLRALEAFVTWFCRVALDQVEFMSKLFEFDELKARLANYVTSELGLSDAAASVTHELLRRGEVARGEVSRITQLPERTARTLLRNLSDAGLVGSSTPKGPISLRFTPTSAELLFPRLFPAQA
jgi:Fic family protein